MSEPLVCAIMLTKDRPAMAARAVRSFRAQTYANKRLLAFDTTDPFRAKSYVMAEGFREDVIRASNDYTIGHNRNLAIQHATWADIIVTFDDDDYSHPNRIAEQVALLQSSGADAVGYREMLFWRDISTEQPRPKYPNGNTKGERAWIDSGEAWLYSHHRQDYALGTSLCYWRKTWERKPFPDLPKREMGTGEDHAWIQGLKAASTTAMADSNPMGHIFSREPRMIASIHGGNSSNAYNLEALVARNTKDWKRATEWDSYCAEAMKL